MRTITKVTILPLTLAALACGQSDDHPGSNALSDELRRDLELAKSGGLELASSAQTFEQAHVVSAIELSPSAVGVARRSSPKEPKTQSVRPRPARAPKPAMAVESNESVKVPAREPVVVAEASPEPSAPAPLPVPQPTHVPVSYPPADETGVEGEGDIDANGEGADADGERGDEGDGSVIGDIIGVVIRGGAVDADHCEIHDRARGRGRPGGGLPHPGPVGLPGGILINDRLPVGQPTFPR